MQHFEVSSRDRFLSITTGFCQSRLVFANQDRFSPITTGIRQPRPVFLRHARSVRYTRHRPRWSTRSTSSDVFGRFRLRWSNHWTTSDAVSIGAGQHLLCPAQRGEPHGPAGGTQGGNGPEELKKEIFKLLFESAEIAKYTPTEGRVKYENNMRTDREIWNQMLVYSHTSHICGCQQRIRGGGRKTKKVGRKL